MDKSVNRTGIPGAVHVPLPLKRETPLEKPNAIGELNERSLHRALKVRYAASGSVTEQAVDGFVADVMKRHACFMASGWVQACPVSVLDPRGGR